MARPLTTFVTDSPIANFIQDRISYLCENTDSTITQTEVARRAGFDKPNFLTMIKSGKANVPINRVLGLARALEVDPRVLLTMVLDERLPGVRTALDVAFGEDALLDNQVRKVSVMIAKKILDVVNDNGGLEERGEALVFDDNDPRTIAAINDLVEAMAAVDRVKSQSYGERGGD